MEAAFAKAIAAFPILGWPIIRQMWTGLVYWIYGLAHDQATDAAAIVDIARRKATDRQFFDNKFASATLRSKAPLTEEGKKNEIAELKRAAALMFYVVPR